MKKKLHLMSEAVLSSYIAASRDLQEMAKGMSAKDVKENSAFVLASALINEIPEDGRIKLDIDDEGKAHIPITGILTNTVTPSAAFEGKAITTYNFIIESIALAESDSRVKHVTYEINTGGGDVDGVESAAIAIAQTKKPSTARVHSSAQSAGILLASQADKVVAIGLMSMFGSVGVAGEFKDRTKADEMEGVKNVILTSTDAPEKRLDITTDEGQSATIKLMDEVHAVMVGHIARGRNLTPDFVNKNFGRGGTMTAERALAVGMTDEIEGIQTQQSTTTGGKLAASTPQSKKLPDPTTKKEENMTLAEFLALPENAQAKVDYNNLLATAKTEGREELKAELKELTGKVKPIMASDSYTKRIKTAGLEVISGERAYQSFTDLVAAVDEDLQSKKSEDVKDKQPPATPGEGGSTPEEMAKGQTMANVEAMKNQLGKSKEVL
jgi:ClpP class serine protease